MTTLRTLKKLLLGETWILPAGLCIAIGTTLVARHVLDSHWQHLGGFALLAAVAIVAVVSVGRSARAR
jgi:hypothetical protein